MQHKPIFKLLTVLLLLVVSFQLTGCGHMVTAIEHSDMQVKLKMTDTIFLDPVIKAKNKTVYVAVNNTSDMQEVDTGMLQSLIAGRLTAKGYQVVSDPSQAGYIIQVNVLYMDYYRQTGTREGALEGALAGAGAGALIGQSRDTSIALGLIGGLVGGLGGALLGKAIKVETYAGVVDVELREKTDKPVTGQMVTNAQTGSATTIQTKQEINTNWQIYRTKIVCTAQQTNIDKNEAARAIAERIATQIGGMF
ncbi:MAG: complement resistance protein TraT [Thermodesulfovibrio sp.]|uniref:complement resistance protein TraT n=1 Tax=Thermodesulfovibrio sp. N1 TaxID=1871110 RepID=UPI00083A0FA8|nr:complement resistance protein TraT [Thermodesulfovibrio sp. N1]MDI6714675.1 complement resistance protein TraT [Thermodesulfovibrio sp.]ODA44124.1 IncF plasmid conjugative transfer surface exclusion protein TraT [Thermodesulfovibrio sp. N1]